MKGLQNTLVKAHKPNMVQLNINVNSVRIKQFKHKIPTHINQVNMNESNINVTSVIIFKALNYSYNQRFPTGFILMNSFQLIYLNYKRT